MKEASKRLVAVAVTAALVLMGCSGAGGDADRTTTTTATQHGAQPIADGTWFAFVTVGEDETGEMTLGMDLAEMLTGEEARQAAIEAGVITEDDVLPNDFFIVNDEAVLELVHTSDDARFRLISGADVSQMVEVDAAVFAEIYEGTYAGDPLYGVLPGEPIAMDVTIASGVVTEATAVYLP